MSWSQVLVGVDGSEGARRALRHAVEEAEAHGARLTALTAYTVPAPPVAVGYAQPPWRDEHAWREDAERLVVHEVAAVRREHPDLEVGTLVVPGPAARALIDASRDSDLLVVGSRGHGGFAGMLLGSVSQHVAAHAGCPVVVVR